MAESNEIDILLDACQRGSLSQNQGFADFGERPVLLYGAGNLGLKFYDCLRENGIRIAGFIDRYQTKLKEDYPKVYSPEDCALEKWRGEAVVILSALFSRREEAAIRENLGKIGFLNIYALHELNMNAIESQSFCNHIFIGSYNVQNIFGLDRSDVRQGLELFTTYGERNFYLQYIQAYLTNDFTLFDVPEPIEEQYLGYGIPKEMNFSNFIDCGAFDGDTLRNLKHKNKVINNYAAFEPQGNLCVSLASYLRAHQNEFQTSVVFPCGVHSETRKFRFRVDEQGKTAGKIDEDGNDIIQCAAIDDVLQGFSPTCIKMDIEGAELEAIYGAKRTIQQYHPQLAVCVYHDLSHIWRIPLLIKSFYNGYRFYLRNYQYMGLETVVYAIPDDK